MMNSANVNAARRPPSRQPTSITPNVCRVIGTVLPKR